MFGIRFGFCILIAMIIPAIVTYYFQFGNGAGAAIGLIFGNCMGVIGIVWEGNSK